MAAPVMDVESGRSFLPLAVRCRGSSGTVTIAPQGDFVFTPHHRPGGVLPWLAGLLHPQAQAQHIPAHQLLGARLESPTAFTVWFATQHCTRTGCVVKQRYKACSTPRFEANDSAAVSALIDLIRSSVFTTTTTPTNPASPTNTYTAPWGARPPHVAAIVNPVSGRGGASRLLREELLPLLRDVAGVRVTVLPTRAPLHAAELVRDMRLRLPAGEGAVEEGRQAGRQQKQEEEGDEEGVDVIMFVGGDGTLHEGLQGLFQRPDWAAARRIPLLALPSGSGNGLAGSCGLWDPVTAVVALLRGRTAPVDVASVLQPPGNRFYCMLSVVYGAMANLDIGTEHLRWMGELRFHLGGVWELIRGRCYSARVFLMPPQSAAATAAPATSTTTTTNIAPLLPSTAAAAASADSRTASTASAAGSSRTAGGGGGGGGEGGRMRERLLQEPESAEGGSGAYGGDGSGTQLSDYPSGPPLPLLSQLPSLPARLPDSPSALPGGWRQLPDAFAIFGAYNTQYLALGARPNPGGHMGDGAWEVWHVEADGCSSGGDGSGSVGGAKKRASAGLRLRCLRVLLGIEDGSFAKTPGTMQVTQARALLFEQRDQSSWTVLDGEAAPNRPLFLEVHPGLCSLVVAPGWREEEA